ncbi:MAG: TIGR03564 family F420-dependent LLM class oxidoreductase [Myxococcota bacterium]
MRIGIFVSETWGAASGIDEVRERARRAEALGFASGWVPYLPWSLDAFSAIQAAGEATGSIPLGTAVVPTWFFHPLAMARQAATVQAAIGRPIELGVGCSNVAVISMHGLPYERPARHVREYVEILSAALAAGASPVGEREKAGFVQYAGDFFKLGSIYGTPGTARPGRLLVGALGPQMLRVAGAYTDGTIATWADPGAIARGVVPTLTQAAQAAGRPAPTVAAVVAVCITNRAEEVRARAQAEFGFYQGAMPYRRMLEVGDAKQIGDVCVIGDEEAVARRLRAYVDAGLTDFLAAPLADGESTWRFTAERLAAIRL